MNLAFINHEELGVSIDFINSVIDEMNGWSDEEFAVWQKWWTDNNMPEGLQCVEIHLHESLRAWIDVLFTARGLNPDDSRLRTKVALAIDAMIS